jgi:glutamine cyclotransferase
MLSAGLALAACDHASRQADVPEYAYDVVRTYPHDRHAFTEGLFYLDGFLYESTGMLQQSSVRKVRLETGEVLQQYDLPAGTLAKASCDGRTGSSNLLTRLTSGSFTTSPVSGCSASSGTQAKVGHLLPMAHTFS